MTSLRQLVSSAYPEYAAASKIPDIPISGIECDSRKVEKDFVFVAVRGAKQDGGAFIKEALTKGASAIIVDKPVSQEINVPWVVLPDSREAIAKLSRAFYGDPSRSMMMVGVTGTNGKTTTTYLLEHILLSQKMATGIFGTISYRFGGLEVPAVETTPGPLKLQKILSDMKRASCKVVAMEVSSHALDQNRVEGIEFHAGVFTNLTQDHLDYHQDLENYFAAKSKLFTSLKPHAYAILNQDDPWGRKLASMTKAKVVRFGMQPPADLQATDIEKGFGETRFTVRAQERVVSCSLPMMGLHNVYNALGAIATAMTLGVSLESSVAALKDFSGVPGRLEPVRGGQDFSVLVDFAHTPDGLLNVLRSLQEYRKKRLTVVFGCGGDRDRTKRPQMAAIAAQFCDDVIVTSDNPRSEEPRKIAEEICAGFPADFRSYQVSLDRRKAIRLALLKARTGDIVLLAGKGHERCQVIGQESIPFSDKEEALKVLSGH